MQPNKTKRPKKMSDMLYAFLLMLPVILVFTLVALLPLVQTFYTSFHVNRPAEPWMGNDFIGLKNYFILFDDSVFWRSLSNTIYFTVVSVFFELMIGLAMALILNRNYRGKGIMRGAIMLPWAIPTVIAANAFMFMYNDVFGVINDLLMRMNIIERPVAWLSLASTAMNAVIVADVWKCFPFITIILLANLQSIPTDIYESAKLDGASRIKEFFYITLPFLWDAIFAALLFRTIDAIRVFDMITVLTDGGPADSTNVIMTNVYRYMFRYMNFDLGAAASVLVFFVVLIFALFYMVALAKKGNIE